MKRTVQVYAQLTDNRSGLCHWAGKWYSTIEDSPNLEYNKGLVHHHLYFTSQDQEIRIGDYYIGLNGLSKRTEGTDDDSYKEVFKVIASIDPNLPIAKIPSTFIEYFVKQQGDVKKVWLEYPDINPNGGTWNEMPLKLNPNGEVIWSVKEEKLYTREELEEGIKKYHEWLVGNEVNPYASIWSNKHYPQ